MIRVFKLVVLITLMFLSVSEIHAQPVWIAGTPSVASTGPLSITLNYGLDRVGTVYVIVYNYNNTSALTSSFVRFLALAGPNGTIVETAVISVKRDQIGRSFQVVLDVSNPDQIHSIYIVAADSKRKLQNNPVRLVATTLPCPIADAGTGGEECDRNFVLNAVPVLGTGIWTRVSGPGNASFSPNASSPDATVTVTEYGSYVFRWTEAQGVCRSSDEITVNFYRPPVADAGRGGNACGLDFTLRAVTGTEDVDGTWSMTSGSGTATFLPDPHSPTVTVTVSEYGTKVFAWTVNSGPCSASSDVSVTFNMEPVANAGPGGNNCGLEFYLNAVPSTGTGTWTRVSGPGSASFNPDNHTPSARVTVTAYGTYIFMWTEVEGPCSSSSTVTVAFFQQISANAGNGGDECDRDFRLNAVPGSGTGTWSMVSGPGNATFSPNVNQYNAIVTVTQPGAYDFEWTEVNNTCTSSDIIRVVFHSPPAIYAGPDAAICKGSTIKLQAEGSGTFQWSPANPLNNPTIPDPLASPDITTIFTVTLTDQWSCSNSDQVTIGVRDKPVADAGPDQTLDFVFEALLEASALNSYESGEWKVLSGTGKFLDKNSNITNVTELSIGDNIMLWSVTNGVCAASTDTLLIKINDLLLPTLITPNQDGNNDYFVVRGIESLGNTGVSIFNRWGAVVYSSGNYKNDWDGNDYNGNPLPDDTYFYILKPEKIQPIKGFIVIKR